MEGCDLSLANVEVKKILISDEIANRINVVSSIKTRPGDYLTDVTRGILNYTNQQGELVREEYLWSEACMKRDEIKKSLCFTMP